MKKILLVLVPVFVVVLGGLWWLRASGGGEDDWVCVDGVWVQHGNPTSPAPESGCGDVGTMDTETVQEQSIEQAITEQLGIKYNRPAEDITVTVGTDTGRYAKGDVRFRDEAGGALWFAAKIETGWQLVADGQGPMACVVAEQYAMPTELVPGCLSETGEMVTR